MGALYSINFPNGMRYIGVTTGRPTARFRQHRHDAVRGQQIVHRAMRKHGVENVEFEVLVIAEDREYLGDLERRAIEAFGTLVPGGYNAIPGGGIAPDAYRMPESERAKRRGRKASAETRAKMSASHLGQKRPASYSEKLSARSKGNKYGRGRWEKSEGVYFNNRLGKWVAQIAVDGKKKHLGCFIDKDAALAARRVAVASALNGVS